MEETNKQIRQLAHLARLSLTPQEEGELAGRLEQMVEYLHALSQVEEGKAPDVPSAATLRPDEVKPSLSGDQLLAQAPRVTDGYVVTPRSVGEGGAE
ncbi:Asp-tRNA(Asn)/Glu-tRNA(Gln) amidotransferase subunit GatC [Pseudoflavonifractor sp. An85]|uniref:Asp-tRNA(Asn)/Glu-tRNA(Gln) amidotransferase subunit GatC n=1 Tax=Pseudoflavonifractor sp. An85 TaxID=1965661 RepID=UPI000B391FA6|nr:Asp-tRNA(Asn)/Glu-tRNA(Gln) amidotransferase subunit GatC [Pseudoflavonifractor sp. An85]OUN25616.1 aspartyl/glutamyl-tRNA(Asn/Gln) amidotransferase subunit C [Pseudoflavonifractor sp. An85]